MAGVSVGQGSSGRKRSLDAEMNLVPFIDLLSMCICFLLMTAVWVDLGSINVKQATGTSGGAPGEGLDLAVRYAKPTQLEANLKRKGKVVSQFKIEGPDEGQALSAFQAKIAAELGRLNEDGRAVTSAVITPSRAVNYGNLVSAMDSLRKLQIVNLGVATASGEGI